MNSPFGNDNRMSPYRTKALKIWDIFEAFFASQIETTSDQLQWNAGKASYFAGIPQVDHEWSISFMLPLETQARSDFREIDLFGTPTFTQKIETQKSGESFDNLSHF